MSLFDKFRTQGQGSVFAKVTTGTDKVAEAKGRIAAVDAAHKEIHDVTTFLEGEACRVHDDWDKLHTRLHIVLNNL